MYNILFTICTLLKLYTIGHIAGSGKQNTREIGSKQASWAPRKLDPMVNHTQEWRRPAAKLGDCCLPVWKNWSLLARRLQGNWDLRRNSQLLLLSWRDWCRSVPPYPMAKPLMSLVSPLPSMLWLVETPRAWVQFLNKHLNPPWAWVCEGTESCSVRYQSRFNSQNHSGLVVAAAE